MKYLHIIPLESALISPLVQILNKNDAENEHEFMVTVTFQSVLKNDPQMLCIRGLKCIPSFKRWAGLRRMVFILRKASQADHVIWHSFRTNRGYTPFLLFLNRKLLAKSTWVLSDGEIGNYTNVANRFLNYFTEYVNRYVQTHIIKVGVCFPSDMDVLEQRGVCREKIALLPYPIPQERADLLKNTTAEPHKAHCGKQAPLIQIGMSSQRGNLHLEIIKKVAELTEYTSVFAFIPFRYSMQGMPMASGTEPYKRQVRKWVKNLHCRSVCPDKQVSQDCFINYVELIDAIFLANQTVCQMEILFYFMAKGKKIFMPENSALYMYLNNLGANIQPLEALESGHTLAEVLECSRSNLPTELADFFEGETMAWRWIEFFRTLNH